MSHTIHADEPMEETVWCRDFVFAQRPGVKRTSPPRLSALSSSAECCWHRKLRSHSWDVPPPPRTGFAVRTRAPLLPTSLQDERERQEQNLRHPGTGHRWRGGGGWLAGSPSTTPAPHPGAQHSRRASNGGVWLIPSPCLPSQAPGPMAVDRESAWSRAPSQQCASVSPFVNQD